MSRTLCPATIVSVDAVKLCKQGMVSRLEWAEFYEAPSEPAEAECCCWVLSVLLITLRELKKFGRVGEQQDLLNVMTHQSR